MPPFLLPESTPLVSVIVPCYNEQATICLLLEALYQQNYPRQDMEIIIADGLSSDRTRQNIEEFCRLHPDLSIQVVDNPQRSIPAGLNHAIAVACGEYILRLDAHSMPYPDYVTRCISALEQGCGDSVGGVWEIRPAGAGRMARAIAAAAAHPLGVGDAQYRITSRPQFVDTVPFGAFSRSLLQKVGGFDETLLTNEDYEFNVRVRRSGGRIWLDPDIRSTYIARPSLDSLVRQYGRYGFWKARMILRYPGTIRWRQWLPPAFVLSLIFLTALAPFYPLARWLLAAEAFIYILVLLAASTGLAIKRRDTALFAGLPLAISAMHLSWGAAFLWSLLNYILDKRTEYQPKP